MFREIMVSEIDFKWANEGQNKNNEGLIHKINRALRDDLFFDNGYHSGPLTKLKNRMKSANFIAAFLCEIHTEDRSASKTLAQVSATCFPY